MPHGESAQNRKSGKEFWKSRTGHHGNECDKRTTHRLERHNSEPKIIDGEIVYNDTVGGHRLTSIETREEEGKGD